MADVHDVAAYILQKQAKMTAMKFQKLVYYCQAWHLVWEEKPLFPDPIEAWANGPVCPALYRVHRGQFELNAWPRGNARKLTKGNRDNIDIVLNFYGHRTAMWLSDLTHREDPWRDAREGLAPGDRGSKRITHAAMEEYYSGLY